MHTKVKLQNPYQFSIVPLIIFAIIIVIYGINMLCKKRKKNISENSTYIPKKFKNIQSIKQKHIYKLLKIENDYKNNKIQLRIAYQLISEDVRMFVFEVTDVTTQNFSLEEIKKANMPKLYDVIKEYYEPEFASKSVGDFEKSINKAKGIINEWN